VHQAISSLSECIRQNSRGTRRIQSSAGLGNGVRTHRARIYRFFRADAEAAQSGHSRESISISVERGNQPEELLLADCSRRLQVGIHELVEDPILPLASVPADRALSVVACAARAEFLRRENAPARK